MHLRRVDQICTDFMQVAFGYLYYFYIFNKYLKIFIYGSY